MVHALDMLAVMLCAGVQQEGFEEEVVLPLARMVYGEVGQSYVALTRPEGATLVGKLTNVLKFTVKEIDPTTGVHVLFLCLDVLRPPIRVCSQAPCSCKYVIFCVAFTACIV